MARHPGLEAAHTLRALARAITNWFLPPELLHRQSTRGLAQVFVQTHLIGALLSALMALELWRITIGIDLGIVVVSALAIALAGLPFFLRRTGNMAAATLISFQLMTITALVGTYEYGGFGSPFLPWLLVSLMAGLFYQSKHTGTIIALFIGDVALFFAVLAWREQPEAASLADLRQLGWISIGVAMTYMAFMALYYARIIASRAELEAEAERYRTAVIALEQARTVAETQNRNRQLFFSKMSHELRTPLNAIIGYSELLLEDCEDAAEVDTQRSTDLGRINATGKHLLSLVSDVLDVETIESEDLTLNASRFTLGELCDAVAATARPLMEANHNGFIVDCPLRSDEITSDAKKLRQMLLNLLSNAAKFTAAGTVTLELWVERGLADDRLHAAVRDTGIGIAADALPKLFETYVQADASIQTRFGGTGIGLALTRKFAMLLGGRVTATSRLGEGSYFVIDIPAELPAAGEVNPVRSSREEATAPAATTDIRAVA